MTKSVKMKPKVVDKTKNKIEKPEFITFACTHLEDTYIV